MTAPVESTRARFRREVRRPDEEIDLARAALLIAREEYPQLSVDLYLARLEALAEEVKDRLADEGAGLIVLQELVRVLFERHGFRGNTEAYYDPRNSFLNEVLDRGLGIPITLSLVVLEIGWRLGLPVEGVNFPGHFLVRYRGAEMGVLVDPFRRGEIRFEDQAQELLDAVYGGMVRMNPTFLRAPSRREILVRMLNNLKSVYLNVQDHERALTVVERILLLRPDALTEARDRGMLLARMGAVEEALRELERYLDFAPDARDAGRIRQVIASLKKGGGGEG